jgi:hypothetical protein
MPHYFGHQEQGGLWNFISNSNNSGTTFNNPLDTWNNQAGFNTNPGGSSYGNQTSFTGGTPGANSFTNQQYSNLINNKSSNWMNNGTLQGVGSVLQGVGSLAGAWAGMKGVKLGEKELAAMTEQWNKNYESQAITVNNRLRDQNAWKGAQGRTDMASLVPKYGNIG